MVINAKIIGAGIGPLVAAAVVGQDLVLGTGEMVLWASVISFIGGLSAAWRDSNEIGVLLKTAFNTAIMGAGIVLLASHWTQGSRTLSWAVIGASGLLSLGGLAAVDWVLRIGKKYVKRELNDDNNR